MAHKETARIGCRAAQTATVDSSSFWLGFNKSAMSPKAQARHRWSEALRRVTIANRQHRLLHAGIRYAMAIDCIRYESVDKLKMLDISQEHQVAEKHGGLVRCLQFSPDGCSLITSGCALSLTDLLIEHAMTVHI